jgi:hypothetical protein
MKRFAKLFVVMLGLATLGLVMSIVPRNDANAQSPTPVSVVNTPYVIVRNTPLPVTVRGIALGAPLPVSGNVGANIIGTPNLRVSNPVDTNSNPVPLLTRDADNPAREPVQGSCEVPPTPTSAGTCIVNFYPASGGSFTNVPSGKRLVIEMVSGRVELSKGSIPEGYEISVTLGSAQVPHDFVPRFVGTIGATDIYTVSEQTHLYADPGTTVQYFSETNATTVNLAVTEISGYVISEP